MGHGSGALKNTCVKLELVGKPDDEGQCCMKLTVMYDQGSGRPLLCEYCIEQLTTTNWYGVQLECKLSTSRGITVNSETAGIDWKFSLSPSMVGFEFGPKKRRTKIELPSTCAGQIFKQIAKFDFAEKT